MNLDWTLESAGAVTLVCIRLRNERATDRQVRLRNRLDGPVLPPRRNGTPEAGWDRDGVTTNVRAGETTTLGYACPAPETEPPVADEVEPVQAGETLSSAPDAAVRELDDHRPPRAVLGDGTGVQAGGSAGAEATEGERRRCPDQDIAVDGVCDPIAEPTGVSLPADIDESLTAYRTRIETAEAFSAVGVPEATALLSATDGLAGVESLRETLDTDARELRALAKAAGTLAARAEAATPPVDTLRRLS